MNDIRERLQDTARAVQMTLPPNTGFIVLAFNFGPDGTLEYISNADRQDVVKCLKEFIQKTEGRRWMHSLTSIQKLFCRYLNANTKERAVPVRRGSGRYWKRKTHLRGF